MNQTMGEDEAQLLFKFILIGDVAVGKTSLLKQFVESKFRSDHNITIGVEFNTKTIQIDDVVIKLQIWDTSGQENFKSVTRLYYRAAVGAIMVYDITNRESFENIQNWHNEAIENGNQIMQFLLIGNKTDLEQFREVEQYEAEQYANANECQFTETSAKAGFNVENAFMQLAHQIYQKVLEQPNLVDQNYGIKRLQGSISKIKDDEDSKIRQESFQEYSLDDMKQYHGDLKSKLQNQAACKNCCQQM